jgi:hypothetical protein
MNRASEIGGTSTNAPTYIMGIQERGRRSDNKYFKK